MALMQAGFINPCKEFCERGSHRNNLAQTLQKEINNLSSKKRCSGVFLNMTSVKGSESRQYTPLPLYRNCFTTTLHGKRNTLYLSSTSVIHCLCSLTNMYLDCCKYVYIFTWRGCDIYMWNFLLGDNQEPLFL